MSINNSKNVESSSDKTIQRRIKIKPLPFFNPVLKCTRHLRFINTMHGVTSYEINRLDLSRLFCVSLDKLTLVPFYQCHSLRKLKVFSYRHLSVNNQLTIRDLPIIDPKQEIAIVPSEKGTDTSFQKVTWEPSQGSSFLDASFYKPDFLLDSFVLNLSYGDVVDLTLLICVVPKNCQAGELIQVPVFQPSVLYHDKPGEVIFCSLDNTGESALKPVLPRLNKIPRMTFAHRVLNVASVDNPEAPPTNKEYQSQLANYAQRKVNKLGRKKMQKPLLSEECL